MSYTSNPNMIFDNSTDANFRNWGSTISASISGMGWVQTSDPQINWSTVTSPAQNTVAGSEFWKPGDAGTSFVLKIEYGSNNQAGVKAPELFFTLATGSDGSGNLTGITTSRMSPTNNQAGKGILVSYDSYFSGDTNRLGMMLWRGLGSGTGSGVPYIFCIERTHNVDGSDNNEGVVIMVSGCTTGGTIGMQIIVFGVGLAPLASRTISACNDDSNTSFTFFNNVPVAAPFPIYGKIGNPLTTLAFVHTQDLPEQGMFQASIYGVSHNYIVTAFGPNSSPWSTAGSQTLKSALRYD